MIYHSQVGSGDDERLYGKDFMCTKTMIMFIKCPMALCLDVSVCHACQP